MEITVCLMQSLSLIGKVVIIIPLHNVAIWIPNEITFARYLAHGMHPVYVGDDAGDDPCW